MDGPGLERVLRDEPRIVLVEFFSEGCEPCRRLAPQLEALAAQAVSRVVAVDVDASPATAAEHGVTVVPTLVFFKHGRELHRFRGGALPPGFEA